MKKRFVALLLAVVILLVMPATVLGGPLDGPGPSASGDGPVPMSICIPDFNFFFDPPSVPDVEHSSNTCGNNQGQNQNNQGNNQHRNQRGANSRPHCPQDEQ